MSGMTLVLADDHRIVLDGLAQLLAMEPDFHIVACCRNGREALEAVELHRPDLLVLDLRMPEMGGLDVLRQLNARQSPTRTVLLTAELDDEEVVEAVRLGVRGLVLKEMAPELLIQCVRTVHAGGEWLEKQAVTRALERVLRGDTDARSLQRALTPKELEVARLIARGLSNKEIARVLEITEGTVKLHLHNVYDKLALRGRMELAILARRQGLV